MSGASTIVWSVEVASMPRTCEAADAHPGGDLLDTASRLRLYLSDIDAGTEGAETGLALITRRHRSCDGLTARLRER